MTAPIYLDYAATTPVSERAAKAMSECLTRSGTFANPASRSHVYGWQAEEKVEESRGQVAQLLGCDPREVVWTSGATEANNLALKGVFETHNYQGHLITSTIEHKAIIDPARWLESKGVDVTWLEPNADGVIEVEQVRQALRGDTRMVSLMHVNNEVGAINPIAEIGSLCQELGVLMHSDAAQAAGKIAIDVDSLNVDMLSLSAHKFYGPKGVGCLYVKRSAQPQVALQMHGGGQERGIRSGTLPTHQVVGMGEAAAECSECLDAEAGRLAELRDRLWHGVASISGARRNGGAENVSPAHLNVCFSGVEGEVLLLSLRELAISSGSACASASLSPSYVLKAMGLSDTDAHSSVRFSLGRYTSEEDVERAIEHIHQVVAKLQSA